MVYRYSIFDSNDFGHGGEKRTAQISEILSFNNIEFELLPTCIRPVSKIVFLVNLFKAIFLFCQLCIILKRLPSLFFFKKLKWASFRLSQLDRIKPGIFFWEATRPEHAFILPYLRRRGFFVIAFPHNLESLVPRQVSVFSRKESPEWLFEEVKLLKLCDKVFSISKEETLLLRQFGVDSTYLPYYPTKTVIENCLSIRKCRLTQKNLNTRTILLLGSANNPPTKDGLINRIRFFQKNPQLGKVIIAGYYTDVLIDYIQVTDNIQIIGELSLDELSQVLSQVDLVLIHQPATSGALTRIIELQFAGVPIVCNFDSARDYYYVDSLHIYDNDDELKKILLMPSFYIPTIPNFKESSALLYLINDYYETNNKKNIS